MNYDPAVSLSVIKVVFLYRNQWDLPLTHSALAGAFWLKMLARANISVQTKALLSAELRLYGGSGTRLKHRTVFVLCWQDFCWLLFCTIASEPRSFHAYFNALPLILVCKLPCQKAERALFVSTQWAAHVRWDQLYYQPLPLRSISDTNSFRCCCWCWQ